MYSKHLYKKQINKILDNIQIEYVKKLELPFPVQNDLRKLTDSELTLLSKAVSDYFIANGFNKEYEPNDIVLIGESIMDMIADL